MRETWVQSLGSVLGLRRSPGEGKGYPLQYSGLENSMDSIVHGVAKSRTRLSDFHFHFHHCCNKLLQTQWHDTNLLLFSSRSQKSKVGLSRLTLRCQQSCLPSGGSRGESVSCLSQLLEAAHAPCLMASSSIFKASNGVLSLSHAAVSLVSLLPPSSTFKGPWDYIGPTWIIQESSCILRLADLQP